MLAAIVTSLAVLAATGVVAHTRRELQRYSERHRAMAVERGLTVADVRQLEHLARMVADTTLADLMISPIRYSRAVSRYVNRLKARKTPETVYFGVIVELTRLRRKVHPPGKLLRFLYSTRELPEGEEVTLAPTDRNMVRTGAIWSVNEDHFDIRLIDALGMRLFRPGAEVIMELNRPGQGMYRLRTTVRKCEVEPRPIVRLEHAERVSVENRREHLRERTETSIFITPATDNRPIEATLQDISGGGLSFILPRPLKPDTECRITLMLGDGEETLEASCVVLRREDLDDGMWHHVGVWDGLEDDAREDIVRYVFTLHRDRIRTSKTA